MDDAECRTRLATARIGRLATVRDDDRPHVVPVCFAIVGDEIVTAVDAKPKSTRALQRLANVTTHPHASLLVDHYDDDWTTLWWVRADGAARVVDLDDTHLAALQAKYAPYREQPPAGPAIVVAVTALTGWSWH